MRVVVVGGGISGLSAAHRLIELAKDAGVSLELELLEAAPRLGGSMWTESIDAYRVVEHGADMFITDKPWALSLVSRLGLERELITTSDRFRRSLVLCQGKPMEVPEGFALMAPTRLWPMVKTPLLSIQGKARAALELALPRRSEPADESIASFVRRRFGQELLERIVQPLVGGIYTGDPEQLSLRATLPRFIDMEREHRSVTIAAARRGRLVGNTASGARYGLFVSPSQGMRSLVHALSERIRPAATIRLGNRAVRVLRSGSAWRIERSLGGPIESDGVVVALPSYRAAELVREVDATLALELEAIPYASTAVVVTGHALADVRHPLDAFGLVVPHIERRRVLAISFASRKLEERAPTGSVQLRTFVGGALQPELFDLSDARIEGIVERELRELLGVEGPPDFIRVLRHARAMPQYLVGHLDLLAKVDRAVAALPGLALAGNAYRGVGIPDCVHSGEAAAEAVFRVISASSRERAILSL